MILYSFWKVIDFKIVHIWTVENYIRFFSSGGNTGILLKTIIMALIITLCCLTIGYPFAYLLSKKITKLKYFLLIMIIIPFMSNFVIRTYAWATILGRNGLINNVLIILHIIKQPLSFIMYSNFSTVMGLISLYIPYMILPIFVSLERIDNSLLEAAADLNASFTKTFFKIIVPLSFPGVMAGIIFTFVPILGEYIVPKLIGGPTGSFLTNVIVLYFGQSAEWGYGSAMAFTLMLIVTVVLIITNKYIKLDKLF